MANPIRTFFQRFGTRRATRTLAVAWRAQPGVEELEARRLLSASGPTSSLIPRPVEHAGAPSPSLTIVISVHEHHSSGGLTGQTHPGQGNTGVGQGEDQDAPLAYGPPVNLGDLGDEQEEELPYGHLDSRGQRWDWREDRAEWYAGREEDDDWVIRHGGTTVPGQSTRIWLTDGDELADLVGGRLDHLHGSSTTHPPVGGKLTTLGSTDLGAGHVIVGGLDSQHPTTGGTGPHTGA
jgi:hypothetical protein